MDKVGRYVSKNRTSDLSDNSITEKRKEKEKIHKKEGKNQLYFVIKIVLVIEKKFCNSRLKAENLQKKLISLEQFIQTVKGRSEQFLVTECFLTCSWRFLRSNELEQLEFKLEKIIGI